MRDEYKSTSDKKLIGVYKHLLKKHKKKDKYSPDTRKLYEKRIKYLEFKKVKIEIIKLNKLFISLNKVWARKDMERIKKYLAKIEKEVKWKCHH